MSWYKALYKKEHKYKAKKEDLDGYSFPSKGHAACYGMLKLLQRACEIKILQVEDHVYLSDARILYIADFRIFDLKINREAWCEFKGFETPEWRLKRKLWITYGPGPLRIYKSTGGRNPRIFLFEEIIPKSSRSLSMKVDPKDAD